MSLVCDYVCTLVACPGRRAWRDSPVSLVCDCVCTLELVLSLSLLEDPRLDLAVHTNTNMITHILQRLKGLQSKWKYTRTVY